MSRYHTPANLGSVVLCPFLVLSQQASFHAQMTRWYAKWVFNEQQRKTVEIVVIIEMLVR